MPQEAVQNIDQFDGTSSQFMTLAIGELDLLVPRADIVAVESTQSLDFNAPTKDAIGWIHFNNHKIPVYNLTEQLTADPITYTEKSICVVLGLNGTYISITGIETGTFNEEIIKCQQLPECIQAAAGPIDSLCIYSRKNIRNVGLIVSTKSLINYFNEFNSH